MPVSQENISNFAYSASINRRVWDNQFSYENFSNNPVVSALGGGASSGVTGATNIMEFIYSNFEYNIKGTQTITAPSISALSEALAALNPEMDLTANDGVEICGGILSASPTAFKIGADNGKPFYFRARISLSNPFNTDDCAVGFRKQEAYQANIDDYADMAVLNVIAGDIKIETIVGGASTVTTDTTQNFSASSIVDLQVDVDTQGNVSYLINGIAPIVSADYSFTDALFITPFFFFLHDSTNTDVITFNQDFVASNSIVATVNGSPLSAVPFTTDQATTIALVAAAIAALPIVSSSTVTGADEITVVFNPGSANIVNSVITTGGASQPTASIVVTASTTTGIRILEWECGQHKV